MLLLLGMYLMYSLSVCRFDVHASAETRNYFDCFCLVANGIGVSPSY